MKPEQFIKRYGVDEVKKVLADAPEGTDFIGPYDSETILVDYYKAFDDGRLALWNENEWVCLRRVRNELPSCFIPISLLEGLVGSLDLVKELGGIKSAKETLADICQLNWNEFEGKVLAKWTSAKKRLERSIKDHESIYGDDHE